MAHSEISFDGITRTRGMGNRIQLCIRSLKEKSDTKIFSCPSCGPTKSPTDHAYSHLRTAAWGNPYCIQKGCNPDRIVDNEVTDEASKEGFLDFLRELASKCRKKK